MAQGANPLSPTASYLEENSSKQLRAKAMAKSPFSPTRQQVIDVFNNSLTYEVLFTFGVPVHNPYDYCNWEAINFNRMAHARLLYDFLEQPIADRYKDNVLAEDFGYPARMIALPASDRQRLNKDLMHLTYDPMIGFGTRQPPNHGRTVSLQRSKIR
jgi:hypothetical protein